MVEESSKKIITWEVKERKEGKRKHLSLLLNYSALLVSSSTSFTVSFSF